LELTVPIRFPCDHCGGVLSIARRKAYALVDCPKCGCKQVVPSESRRLAAEKAQIAHAASDASDTPPVAVAEAPKPPADRPLFERKELEDLLTSGLKSPKSLPPVAGGDAVQGVELVAEGSDILLHRRQLTLAIVLAILAALFVFGLGLLVGRFA
jgi:phage FluMu protein Com